MNGAKASSGVFHCHVEGCVYAEGSERHFKTKKLLKQHFVKVHAEKVHACSKCKKGFGHEQLRRSHEQTCGVVWQCYTCHKEYTSRETLLTHERRTGHVAQAPDRSPLRKRKQKPPVPHAMPPLILVINNPILTISASDVPSQPISQASSKHRQILPKETAEPTRAPSRSVQVQTEQDPHASSQGENNILERAMEMASIPMTASRSSQCSPRWSRKQRSHESTHTQTHESALSAAKQRPSRRPGRTKRARRSSIEACVEGVLSGVDCLLFDAPDLEDFITYCSSGTQTGAQHLDPCLDPLCDLQECTTQTDVASTLFSNIETQTARDLAAAAYPQAHTETQTTEDFLSSLADIETQTAWDDIAELVAESPSKQDADLADMETQTPFALCGPELIDSYAQTLDLEFASELFNT